MKKFVKPTPPEVNESGNRAGTRFTTWARYCARIVGITTASAVLGLSTHAATQLFPGIVKREVYNGQNRTTVENGTAGAPSSVTFPTTFEAPSDVADNYAQKMSGWFIPPTTGSYYFIVSSDDDSDLFLSTDSNPANKRMVAQQPGWNSTRNWPGDGGGATPQPQKNSQTFSASDGTKPFAAGIPLTAGTPYYIEAVMHEGGGGDNLGVTAQLIGTPIPASGDDAAIPTEQIGLLYIVPTSFTASITPGSTTANVGTSVHFTANVTTDTDDAVTYQWRTNGVAVAGATGKTFSTQILSASDTGLKVDVVAGLAHFNNTATSSQSTITVPATGGQSVTGYLKWEYFPNASRTDLENGNVGAPAWVRNLTSFETPSDFADNYAQRVSGYFIPATSGNYTFEISSDDDSDLFLSTDSDPAHKRLIAQQPNWNATREWAGEGGTAGAPGTQRVSDTWVPDPTAPVDPTPFAGGIPLTVGQKYYIEAVHHEGGGGDNLAVTAWLTTSGTPPADGDPSALTGNVIGYATSPATTLTITTQPHNATVTEGFGTNFVVAVSTDSQVEPVYQWKRNGVDIPGATSSSYTVSGAAADNNAVYSVVVSIPGTTLTATSQGGTLTVNSAKLAIGFLKWEFFKDKTRPQVEDGSAGQPTRFNSITSAEGPTGYDDNYASRISGFFIPPTTDNYVFFVCSDDDSDLFLSTDDSPANKHLIAQETGWSDARNWNGVNGNATGGDQKRSDTFTNTQWPDGNGGVSNTIHLTAGTRYYFEAVQHEGGGGDNLGVNVVTEAEAAAGDPANGTPSRLTGTNIAFFVPASTVTITQQPVNVAITEGRTATFSVGASTDSQFGSPSYQWQRNGANIAGATSSTFTTPVQSLANNNDKYTVIVSAPGANPVTSSQVTLTVNADTVPPAVIAAGAVKRGTGIEIGVGFDESIDATTAVAANFTLSKGAVTNVRNEPYVNPVDQNAPVDVKSAVVLETSGLAAGDTVTVTVKNVKDIKGNPIPAAGVQKSVTVGKMNWVGIGGNDYQDAYTGVPAAFDKDPANYYDDTVALKTDTDFDLISGGSGNWNNYDEATFVYEEITGDFDRIARVEYQDPSSQWARAGIMARAAADENVKHVDVDNGYQMAPAMIVRVNPAVQWNGAAGNNSYEWVWRDLAGGNYASSGGGGAPAYPHAWLRLQRSGQLFTGFRSDDGTTWVNIGTHDWSTVVDANQAPAPMPDKLLVGPYFGPELNNNDAWSIGHSVVAKFRDYKPFGITPPPVQISSVTQANGSITINWTGGGTLEWTSALTPGGTWTSTGDSDGSYSETISAAGNKFFRVKK